MYTREPGLASVATGLPELGLGAVFIATWVNPAWVGVGMVKFALELMLLEFILIHSAGFMGLRASAHESMARRLAAIAGYGLFYSMFVLGFCLALHIWRPMWTFWIVTVQRMAADFLDPKPTDETKAWFSLSLGVNAAFYLAATFMTLILPLPRLAVTRAVRDALDINGSGLWQSEPHRVVVMAGLYYMLRGYFTASARPRRVVGQIVR